MRRIKDPSGLEEAKAEAKASWNSLFCGDRPVICTGMSTCGISAGARESRDLMRSLLSEEGLEAKYVDVGCLGLCYSEPLLYIKKPGRPMICYGNVSPKAARSLARSVLINDEGSGSVLGAIQELGCGETSSIPPIWEHPMLKSQVRIALKNCGIIDPENLGHYIARGGYAALAKTLSITPEAVIEEVKTSGLRGRGGAGFPTGMKWEFCRKSKGDEKYLICNADEGDPGAFMDRSVLEGDPHAVIEGMLIAAYAIGCTQGFIYCRAEYPLALRRLEVALQQAKDAGFLGENILGSGFDFDIAIKEGAGAFVCGEETALMASIEGKRGMPRTRPPFPANAGLWSKPTNINNVETLANLPSIIDKGGKWYSAFGIGRSRGTKTLALAGAINRPGLIEVPMGMNLRQIIFDIGGGIPRGKACKGVLTGGPSGGCIPASNLDIPMDYEAITQAGSIVGSGSMIVIDEDTCIVDLARFFLAFTQRESCGKCTPCRIGTKQMLGLLEKITQGQATKADLAKLEAVAQAVRSGSLCGLGAGSPNPVLTSLRYFRPEYEEHIVHKHCPSMACSGLTSHSIDQSKCKGCGLCVEACPVGAILGDPKKPHSIDQERCIKCGACILACPGKFSAISKRSGAILEVA